MRNIKKRSEKRQKQSETDQKRCKIDSKISENHAFMTLLAPSSRALHQDQPPGLREIPAHDWVQIGMS